MTKRYQSLLPVVIIILVAGMLRYYRLGEVPVSIYWDEVAFGYNAYSILQTGRDEYGKLFPLFLQSFNDFKLAGYAYLSLPFIWLFGLSEFSVRFASAFLGTGTVGITYLMAKELLRSEVLNDKLRTIKFIPLISAGLLAVSPWHLQFSRSGYEANAGLFFIVLGAWLFFKGLTNKRLFYVSIITFGLSWYIYRGAHITVPILLTGLSIMYWKKLGFRQLLFGVVIFLITIAPLVPKLFTNDALQRNRQVSISNEYDKMLSQSALEIYNHNNSLFSRIFYNRRLIYVRKITENIFSHINYQYLFIRGDQFARHSVTDMGVMYRWEMPFITIGFLVAVFSLVKKGKSNVINKRTAVILIFWLIAGILPAALAIPSPHALRSMYMLPILQLVTALGIAVVPSFLPRKMRVGYFVGIGIILILFLSRYLGLYYGKNATVSAVDWGDGYKQVATYVFNHENSYDHIVISGHYWKPYIYFLFYSRYDPQRYQQSGNQTAFSNYTFGGTSWGVNEVELDKIDVFQFADAKNVLIAFSPEEYRTYRGRVSELETIYSISGKPMFIMAKIENKQNENSKP
jgi:4-amino-4-deoxy-L-arabinose transferase-like glycosyltransferase